MPQLTGPEQKNLVHLLIEHLSEPDQLDRALIDADLGGFATHSEPGTFPAMTSNVVRRFSSRYRTIDLVEAVLNGDYLKGECPPIQTWLDTNREELKRRANSPGVINRIFDRNESFGPERWIAIVVLALLVIGPGVYFFSRPEPHTKKQTDPSPPPPAAPEEKSGQVAMLLSEEQIERLKEQLGITSHEEIENRSRMWVNGTTINIAFLDGDKPDQEFVKSVAKEWTDHANLKFKFDDDVENSEVRISLSEPGQSYSYLGTDCLGISKTDATMQLGMIRNLTDQDQRRFQVLHEFGHMLGLINEHQAPNSTIDWNWERIRQDPIFAGGSDFIDSNLRKVSRKQAPHQYSEKRFDPASVLMYFPIPKEWLRTPLPKHPDGHLSPGDMEFVEQIYPRP